jgi:hypothetical protein
MADDGAARKPHEAQLNFYAALMARIALEV